MRRGPGTSPPLCWYYLEAMRLDKEHQSAQVISENDLNPCVGIIVGAGATFWTRPVYDDIAILLTATMIVTGARSFIDAIMMLTRVRKRVYAWDRAVYPDHLPHFRCEASPEYRSVMKNWQRAPAQVEFMKTAKACSWWAVYPNGTQKVVPIS
jgi:hypothetical protein